MSQLFQINEEDLAELERLLPDLLFEVAIAQPSPKVRTACRRVKDILGNVRWHYGPPEQVERVEP